MEINAEELSKFLHQNINHHEKSIENILEKDNYDKEDKYAKGYHMGSIHAYKHITEKFNLNSLF